MRRTQIQFVKFLLVGALNTAFGYGIYALLIWFGLRPFLAVGLATVLAVLFNFQSTGRSSSATHIPACSGVSS